MLNSTDYTVFLGNVQQQRISFREKACIMEQLKQQNRTQGKANYHAKGFKERLCTMEQFSEKLRHHGTALMRRTCTMIENSKKGPISWNSGQGKMTTIKKDLLWNRTQGKIKKKTLTESSSIVEQDSDKTLIKPQKKTQERILNEYLMLSPMASFPYHFNRYPSESNARVQMGIDPEGCMPHTSLSLLNTLWMYIYFSRYWSQQCSDLTVGTASE